MKELELLNKDKRDEKAVIVSQWTSMLDVISKHLVARGIKFISITGQIPVKDRGAIVEQFNIRGKNPKVCSFTYFYTSFVFLKIKLVNFCLSD